MATTGGALLWGTHRAWAAANDRVRVAVVGIHGMGQSHIQSYQALPNVEVAALCDVDANLFCAGYQTPFLRQGLENAKNLHRSAQALRR
jgi:predicted dehydrogenase